LDCTNSSVAETVHNFTAPDGTGRIDRWLATELDISRGRVQVLLEDGLVSVDGEMVKAARKLRGGEAVQVRIPPPPDTTLLYQPRDLDIVFEDEHVIVLNKPADLVVHPGKGNRDHTLVNVLLDRLDSSVGHPERPGIVHRLDKGTSGVMCVARTQRAYDSLTAQFAAHTVERRYRALCWGYAKTNKGTVDADLARHPKDRKRFAVVSGGKRAVTHWSVVGRSKFKVQGGEGWASWFQCRLETGRTHQVRVHLSHLGHPLIGDPMYTRPVYRPKTHIQDDLKAMFDAVDHQLLHAWAIGFEHPVSGETMRFERPPPADYAAVLSALDL
jgi:23S rRNA pseudouridine1911/1915/1917 synthase